MSHIPSNATPHAKHHDAPAKSKAPERRGPGLWIAGGVGALVAGVAAVAALCSRRAAE